jgi:hypothetical protein
MNLFREVRSFRRRSSSANSNKESAEAVEAADDDKDGKMTSGNGEKRRYAAIITNGHASLRRSMLPRSRTTSNDLGKRHENDSTSIRQMPCSSTSVSLSSKATTDWSYCQPPKQPPRALLGGRRLQTPSATSDGGLSGSQRSATVPNFQEATGASREETSSITIDGSANQQQRRHQFSTFKQRSNGNSIREGKRPSNKARPLSADLSRSSSFCNGPVEGGNSAFYNSASSESLLDDDNNCIVTDNSFSAASTTANSLELLNEADEDRMETSTDNHTTTILRMRREVGDVADHEAESNSTSSAASMSMASSNGNNKTNSLPKSAFGSIQLKVQEIREQLDVLKTTSPSSAAASGPPTVPHRSALQLFGLSSYFQSSLPGSSQESTSPRSNSPKASRKQQLQQHLHPPPQRQTQTPLVLQQPPLTSLALSNSSSSPSTLSPCSSNSGTSTSLQSRTQQQTQPMMTRPQPMPRMSHSNSFNCFGGGTATAAGAMASAAAAKAKDDSDVGSVSQADRLVFFLDIVTTQEKIAKVKMLGLYARNVEHGNCVL